MHEINNKHNYLLPMNQTPETVDGNSLWSGENRQVKM